MQSSELVQKVLAGIKRDGVTPFKCGSWHIG